MGKIFWVYAVTLITNFSLYFVSSDLWDGSAVGIIAVAYLAIAVNLVWRDAKSRGLPVVHGFWVLLGLLGIIVYHLGFAKNHPVQ